MAVVIPIWRQAVGMAVGMAVVIPIWQQAVGMAAGFMIRMVVMVIVSFASCGTASSGATGISQALAPPLHQRQAIEDDDDGGADVHEYRAPQRELPHRRQHEHGNLHMRESKPERCTVVEEVAGRAAARLGAHAAALTLPMHVPGFAIWYTRCLD